MRMSHLFGRTLREATGDVELPSHRLMLRAALMRPLGAGIYSLLPLGWRVVRKVEQIIREEMNAIGGPGVVMPRVDPAGILCGTGGVDPLRAGDNPVQDPGRPRQVPGPTPQGIVT